MKPDVETHHHAENGQPALPAAAAATLAAAASYGEPAGQVQKPPVPAVLDRRRLLALLGGVASMSLLPGMGRPARADTRPLRLVAFGDSLTAGYMLPAKDAFPNQLEAALRTAGLAVEVTNAGVSGDTTAQGLARLDWSIPDGTDAVIVELGANDALRGLDPAATRATLDQIVSRLQEKKMAVMLAGMVAPRNLGPDYVRAFDTIYPDLAAKHGVPLYPFFLEGVAEDRKLRLPDGLHPTAEGVAVIVRRILPSVQAFLAKVKPAA
jgi:acyl-CoA thioesterase-1